DAHASQEDTISILTPLQKHYQTLVLSRPQLITHEQFWTRYYYRCNPPLIAERRHHRKRLARLEQQRRRQDGERMIREVSHAALQIGKSAASLFQTGWAGAVGLASNVEKVVEESLKYHPGGGRPPFVMIAGEEDDDEYFEGEEEEEEEEGGNLSWGSDSESDNAANNSNEEEDSIHEEVEFLGGQTTASSAPPTPLKLESLDVVKLRRTLMHAERERNTMMEMVEERNEEIARLNCLLENRTKSISYSESNEEVEEISELHKEAKRLANILALRNAHATINELKLKIDALKSTGDDSPESLDSSIQEELDKQAVLQKKLDEYNERMQDIQKQKKVADERLAQLMLQSHKNAKNNV
ncbi:hypothetical protein ACHAWX_001762, partial [Stephanocyclus meneghinianus]